jgi:hypothetical protein
MSARLTLIAVAAALGACASPEAERVRGGGPGADVQNRDGELEMHAGSEIYYQTPCLTTLPECTGPMPLNTAKPN